ncbi:2-amino-5-chloromuconic acid deaminase [Methylobacterium crusticola]|uniref:2-amino-5-chloromuconic acid deaminase n=1 Tax=Methylobacterium crusticola TaxID=1697972 RepID=A0ABQ4QXG5_9HYPH|nr:amidase [Methylobacterium crusticola]GJD49267.1 2-amino-5-chloromuconic acid deaminase [Methylobacterium crusticola]
MSRPDDIGAFVAHGRVERRGRDDGPLAGLTFGLKDFFDLAGVPTGAGSPEWLATHPVPDRTAPAIEPLFAAGARLVGKTHTDELAWSLNGENARYGTPVNVRAPGRIPGGSSSGSAAATAAGLVDFAIGSDTGGSVRLPASYCGLHGIRTTHGRIPLAGAVPLAPSFDTLGWFTRDAALFARVGAVLLPARRPGTRPGRLLVARDLFGRAGPEVAAALRPALDRVAAAFPAVEEVEVAGEALAAWRNAFRLIQSAEAWAAHGPWVEAARPAFGPGVRERFAAAARLDPAEVEAARRLRGAIRTRMRDLVADAVLVLPTAPGIAPRLATPEAELDAFRARALEILCPAGHAGLPQVSLPAATLDGCPLGLSLAAAPGGDEILLDLAAALAFDGGGP